MDESQEMRRMLAWFKEQLPRHDLGEWHIAATPIAAPIPVEGELMYSVGVTRTSGFRISGRAKCQRCGQYFGIPEIGNATAYEHDQIEETAEEMKAWTQREADREPCWGDVPEVRDGGPECVPVLDGHRVRPA